MRTESIIRKERDMELRERKRKKYREMGRERQIGKKRERGGQRGEKQERERGIEKR